jgi:hypothetical protein
MLNCWILAILETDPSFDLWASRMMKVDNADERGERSRGSRGSQGRHIAVIRNIEELNRVESKPCGRLASFNSAGRGGVGGDDGSSALWN